MMTDLIGDEKHRQQLEFTTQKTNLIAYFSAGAGVVLIFSGVVWEYIVKPLNGSSQKLSVNQNQTQSDGEKDEITNSSVTSQVKNRLLKVDVSGSVVRPGMIEMPYDSRIHDVLITAGGLSPKADRIYVSRNINLAQKVTDGMKIYIPAEGEQVTGLNNNVSSGNLININNASKSELEELNGIGPVTAEKIIQGRPYQAISDLINKKIINPSVYNKIKDEIANH